MERGKEHPTEVWRLNQRVSMETVSNSKSLKAHPKKGREQTGDAIASGPKIPAARRQ